MTLQPVSRRIDRAQQGQAIVLIALMMVVLLGLLGLALDSGRGYVDRRELQDAADAATLAAGDSYENFGDPVAASALAIQAFAANERVSNIGSQSYFSSNPQTYTFASDSTLSATVTITNNAFAGTVFTVYPTHRIPLSVMQVLGIGNTIPISTIARSVVGNQNATPALLTLSQAGCGNNLGNSLVLQGSSVVTVHGDVYSNGTTSMGGSSAFTIGGNAYTNCGGTPASIQYWCYSADPNQPPYAPPCVAPDAMGSGNNGAPIIPDPGYPGGNRAWYPNNYGLPGYENLPGIYTGFSLTGGSGCDWLAPGIYTMSGGFFDSGQQTTNMLKPPDEPFWNNNTVRMSPQFFDAGGCAPNPGFVVSAGTASGSGNAITGTWGVRVTSTRTDYYPPIGQPGSTAYGRESAPSMCRTVNITGANQGIQTQIYKMPGATGYNIYANPNGCSGNFGYAKSVAISGGQGSSVTATVIDKSVVGSSFTPSSTRCPYTVPATAPTIGCRNPQGESAPYNSPSAVLQQGLTAGQAYSQLVVDSTLGQTTVGAVEVISTGDNTTQQVTVTAGSTGTVLNVLPFTANRQLSGAGIGGQHYQRPRQRESGEGPAPRRRPRQREPVLAPDPGHDDPTLLRLDRNPGCSPVRLPHHQRLPERERQWQHRDLQRQAVRLHPDLVLADQHLLADPERWFLHPVHRHRVHALREPHDQRWQQGAGRGPGHRLHRVVLWQPGHLDRLQP